tara:strand:- start:5155 stop:5595 length:441 start_codon:yes stop_codon:yes gene_type:complete
MDIDNILLDLEILNQIKEGDKLAVTILPGKTKLSVDSSSYFSGISRKYNGYNREDSIKYIETLLTTIERSSTFIISGSHTDLAHKLTYAIKNALIGLENYKKTYINDSIISAKLVLIINKLTEIKGVLETNAPDLSLNEIEDLERA